MNIIKNINPFSQLSSASFSESKQRVYFIGLQGVLALFFITPFAMMRFLNNEIIKGVTDILIVIGMLSLSAYVVYGGGKRFVNQLTYFFSAIYILGATVTFYFGDVYSIMWVYPAAISCYFVLDSKYSIYYTTFFLIALTLIGINKLDALSLGIITTNYVATCCLAFILSVQIIHDRRMIENYSFYDVLTGAKTRNLLVQDLQTAIKENKAQPDSHLSLIIFDIDHFKKINDTRGHCIGDHVLKQVTKTVNKQLTSEQNIYRYGGEEFFILVNMGSNEALELAERIRIAAEQADHIAGIKATISLGVAEHKKEEGLEMLTQRADKALYSSKESGRNQVTVAT